MNFIVLTAAGDLSSKTNLLSIATKGGFLMIVLLLISIIAITIIIERLIKLKKSRKDEYEFLTVVQKYLDNNQYERITQVCEDQKNSPISTVIYKVMENRKRPVSDIKEIAELALSKEVYRLEKNLGVLATFAAVAPLIGFLGTVTGMVKVFMRIGETGGGVDISLLANGIWEALVTTIGGLTVGIISILFYNYLVGKVEDIAQELEEKTNEFIFNIRGIRDEN